jgi:hypothetical protein
MRNKAIRMAIKLTAGKANRTNLGMRYKTIIAIFIGLTEKVTIHSEILSICALNTINKKINIPDRNTGHISLNIYLLIVLLIRPKNMNLMLRDIAETGNVFFAYGSCRHLP